MGPLEGYRVIDLTTMISGPAATMILGDQGADVIKVENPDGGDHVRKGANRRGGLSANFCNNNRNKRSVTLDLKQKKGKNILLRLIETADVFIHNFRPGVIERLGLDESVIRKHNKNIIYASIAGFGFEGPYAADAVYDPLIQAVSGLCTIQAGSDEEKPKLIRTIVPDKVSALTAAQAITAGLLRRAATGEGQHIKLTMLDAIVSFMWGSDMGSQTFVEETIPQQRAASFMDLVYETKKGFITVAVMSDKEWTSLALTLNKSEWLEDNRFKTPELRDKNINERLKIIQEALLKKTAKHWLKVLKEAKVPCAPVLTRTEMLNDPQVKSNQIIETYEHPIAGNLRQARSPAVFSTTPSSIEKGAPTLGQHTEEVLREIGIPDEEVKNLSKQA